MGKEAIETTNAPAAIGPYSQAIRSGNTLYLSGQIPLDPSSGEIVEGGVQEQTTQVFENLKAVLAAGGANFDDVVRADVFLADMGDFAVVNGIYAEYFANPPYPARQTVAVKTLPKNVLVEISCIAVVD